MNRTLAAVAALLMAGACSRTVEQRKVEFFESGNRYFAAAQYAEAVIQFRNAVQLDSRFGRARFRLAESHALLGNHSEAANEYIRAADVLPDSIDVQLKAGEYLLAVGRPNDALARADAALKLSPNHVEAHILRGTALAGEKHFDQAISEIEEAIRLDPERGHSYAQLGVVQSARGRATEAENAFRAAVKLAPRDARSHLALATFLWTAGRLAEAEQSFVAAWHLNPKDAQTNRVLAIFSLVTERTAEAEKYLRQLVETAPGLSTEFALTDYYLATGRTREAIDRLQKLVSESPDVPEPKERLARAYAATGDRSKAEALVDEILRQDPRNPGAQLLKGRVLAEGGHPAEALQRVQQAVQADPKSIEAQYALGQLHAARGDVAAAEKAFNEVLRLNPRAAAAHVQISRLQLLAGNINASVRAAEDATKNFPDSLDTRLALVRSLLASNQQDRAEREIAKLLQQYPEASAVHAQSGVLAAARKDFSSSRTKFQRALALDPDSLEALTGLVVLDLMAHDFSTAISRVQARLASKPAAELHVLIARVYAANSQLDLAEGHLRRAIELKPTLLPAYQTLGHLYVRQGKMEQARREFDTLAAQHTDPVAPLTMAGMILQSQGKEHDARKRYAEALARNPRAWVAANNLAWMYVERGENLDLALQYAQAASAAMPDAPEVLDTLGWVYYKKNLPTQAVPPLMRSAEKQPMNPLSHYRLGLAKSQTRDIAGAKAALRRALELQPDFPGADDARRRLAELDRAQ